MQASATTTAEPAGRRRTGTSAGGGLPSAQLAGTSGLGRVTAAARTSPGRLALAAIGLLVVLLAFGLVSMAGLQSRSDALGELATSNGPLSAAAQEIYRSLSDADATAASAFLEGGLESPAVRQRYQQDVANAGSELARAAAAANSERARLAVQQLSTYLPVYTGLVETARTNNRSGLPVGAAYLREASGLMHDTLLPAARQLYESETAQLASTQERSSGAPVVEILLGLLALGCLLAAQRYLTRRTNRLLNVGLLASTAAVVLVLLWVGVAMTSVKVNVDQSREHGSAQVTTLATARIAALEARSNETLTLVARGTGGAYEDSFVEASQRLAGEGGGSGLLGDARFLSSDQQVRSLIDQAIDAERDWRSAHAEIRELDDAGNYQDAVRLAIGDAGAEPDGASQAFNALDERLDEAIELTTARFDDEVSAARSVLTASVPGVVVLTVLAAAGALWGIWRRIEEYR